MISFISNNGGSGALQNPPCLNRLCTIGESGLGHWIVDREHNFFFDKDSKYAHKYIRWIDPKSKGSENLAMACDFLPRSFRSHDIKRPDDDFDDAEDDDTASSDG